MTAARIFTPRAKPARARTYRGAERWGRFAETLAALWLSVKGYRILARRARTPSGEIDLIARRGDMVAIIEVKARASFDQAVHAITPSARRRLLRAAASWRGKVGLSDAVAVRFDAVYVAPWSRPVHHIDAWREDETPGAAGLR